MLQSVWRQGGRAGLVLLLQSGRESGRAAAAKGVGWMLPFLFPLIPAGCPLSPSPLIAPHLRDHPRVFLVVQDEQAVAQGSRDLGRLARV